MKRILYFHHVAALGGASLCLVKLIRALPRDRYEPVVVLGGEGPVAGLLRKEGVQVHIDRRLFMFGYCSGFHAEVWEPGFFRSVLRFPLTMLTAYRRTRGLRPDIVHVNTVTLVAAAAGARCAGAKTVLHVREQVLPGRFGLRRRVLGAVIARTVDHVMAICRANLDACPAPPGKSSVVRDWVPWDRNETFDAARARDALGVPERTRIVLFVGGESRDKGTHVLLAAATMVRTNVPFMVALLGPRWTSVRRKRDRNYVAGLRIHCRENPGLIRCMGPVSNVGDFMAACDFLVFPSCVPHFANPVIEAAWLGKPAVMSDDPVARELIREGETGLLFPKGNVAALAGRMQRLLEHPEECRSLGFKARQAAHAAFSGAESVARIRTIYDSMAPA